MAETAIATTKSSISRYDSEAFLKLRDLPADFISMFSHLNRGICAAMTATDSTEHAVPAPASLRDLPQGGEVSRRCDGRCKLA